MPYSIIKMHFIDKKAFNIILEEAVLNQDLISELSYQFHGEEKKLVFNISCERERIIHHKTIMGGTCKLLNLNCYFMK